MVAAGRCVALRLGGVRAMLLLRIGEIVADGLKLHIQPEPEPDTRPIQIRVSGRYLLPGGIDSAPPARSLITQAVNTTWPERTTNPYS